MDQTNKHAVNEIGTRIHDFLEFEREKRCHDYGSYITIIIIPHRVNEPVLRSYAIAYIYTSTIHWVHRLNLEYFC